MEKRAQFELYLSLLKELVAARGGNVADLAVEYSWPREVGAQTVPVPTGLGAPATPPPPTMTSGGVLPEPERAVTPPSVGMAAIAQPLGAQASSLASLVPPAAPALPAAAPVMMAAFAPAPAVAEPAATAPPAPAAVPSLSPSLPQKTKG